MSAELWILGGTFVVGAGATALSWVAAISAGRKERSAEAAQEKAEAARDEALELSRKATSAFERQAAAQEEANWLKRTELKPPAWKGLLHEKGGLRLIKNVSGQSLVIESLIVAPEASPPIVECEASFPVHLKPGSMLGFIYTQRETGEAHDIILTWRYANEPHLHGANFGLS